MTRVYTPRNQYLVCDLYNRAANITRMHNNTYVFIYLYVVASKNVWKRALQHTKCYSENRYVCVCVKSIYAHNNQANLCNQHCTANSKLHKIKKKKNGKQKHFSIFAVRHVEYLHAMCHILPIIRFVGRAKRVMRTRSWVVGKP